MSTRLIASTIMSVLLVVVLLALSGCESSSTEPNEPIQYESTHEEATTPERSVVQYSNEHIQYHSEGEITVLPDTGPSLR